MNPTKINSMGMELDEWKIDSCLAHFGVGDTWATLYDIWSGVRGKGQATRLLRAAKEYYEKQGKVFGGSVALNAAMKRIYEKLNIKEYC